MAALMSSHVAINGAYHSGKPHTICLNSLVFNVFQKVHVLFSNARSMEIQVYTTDKINQLKQLLRGSCIGHIYLLHHNMARELALQFAQPLHSTGCNAEMPPVSQQQFAHFTPHTRRGSHYNCTFHQAQKYKKNRH